MSTDRSHRAPFSSEVAVEASGSQTFRSALNLSRSGILLASDELPDLGTPVRVVLSLPPGGRFVRLQGRVVRHQVVAGNSSYAVAFEAVEERELAALEAFTARS